VDLCPSPTLPAPLNDLIETGVVVDLCC